MDRQVRNLSTSASSSGVATDEVLAQAVASASWLLLTAKTNGGGAKLVRAKSCGDESRGTDELLPPRIDGILSPQRASPERGDKPAMSPARGRGG